MHERMDYQYYAAEEGTDSCGPQERQAGADRPVVGDQDKAEFTSSGTT
jgi:hypothetical protein